MKRILSIILIIMLAFSCASCGDKGKKAASSDNRQESGLEDVNSKKEDEAQENETDETGLQEEYGKIKESDLSDKYRIDLVPIFKGSVILYTAEDPDHKMVGLACYSKKSYKEVKKYYEKIMSKYEIMEEEEKNGDYREPPSYYIAAKIDDKAHAFVNVIDATRAPDDFTEEFELPKNAKTVFALQYYYFDE